LNVFHKILLSEEPSPICIAYRLFILIFADNADRFLLHAAPANPLFTPELPQLIPLFGFADQGKGDIAMSINAVFVQVEDDEIARFEADPDSVEALFANQTLPTTGLLNMTAAMEQRLRAIGPQTMAATLSRFPDSLRQQIEASLGPILFT
jgi:hypothetical protein